MEALFSACHILNMVPLKDCMQLHISRGMEESQVKLFRGWGCLAYVGFRVQHTPKLGYRGSDCAFIG